VAHRRGKNISGYRCTDNMPDSLRRVVPHRQTPNHYRLRRRTQQTRLPPADDSLNAAPLYQKTIETLVDVNVINKLSLLDFRDANYEQKELIRQWLVKNETALALVVRASELPYHWQHYRTGDSNQGMLGVLLPDLNTFRIIGRALCWRAWLNAETGDFNSAFRDIETCFRFGRHNKGEKILVEQLVGMAIEGRALHTTRQLLDTYKTDSNTLADFQRRLQQLIDNDDFRPNLQSEKLFTFDALQRCLTENRLGLTHVYLKGLRQFAATPAESTEGSWYLYDLLTGIINSSPEDRRFMLQVFSTQLGKAESIDKINAFYKFWDDITPKTPAQLRAEKFDLEAEELRTLRDNPILNVFGPALGRVHIIAWRNKIDAECTPVTIALVRYKQDTGSYPESLDKLVDRGYIKQVPIDPFSGGPLSYKKTEEGPLLYSWGENLTDDGGQVARDKKGKVRIWDYQGDAVFWPVGKN